MSRRRGGGAGVEVGVATLSYGADAAHVLDLYAPQDPAVRSMPAVVLAHGGLWRSGDKQELAALCENVVTASGGAVACASVDYRLSRDLGGTSRAPGRDAYRDQVTDLASAFAYLQEGAGLDRLDPAAIYVGGHSAGGHLAHVLNLRWSDFAPAPAGRPPPAGAIGIEGIYDVAAWDAWDASRWGGAHRRATRRAFGSPPSEPPAALDARLGLPSWEAGSPTYLAENHAALGIRPAGGALVIHSPGDDWVDAGQAIGFGAAMRAAFPEIRVVVSTDGVCAAGQHDDPLRQTALAACIARFVAAGASSL